MNSEALRGQFRSVVGTLVGVTVFVAGLVLDPVLSILLSSQRVEGRIDAGFGYAALALVVAGLCILFASATALVTNRSKENEDLSSALSNLSRVFSKARYSRVLLFSAAVYGVLYAIASGIVVYDPNASFSTVYHVSIPSSAIAICCSPLGQTPLAVIYLTDHVGFLLIPVNLLLLFSISWLVGLNAALGAFVFSLRITRKGIGWFGGAGAFMGLFTSCPTCASLAIFSIVGGAGTLSGALLLGTIQALFVGVSIPVLVASPIILVRSLYGKVARACPI